jgi:acyl dehydratase
MEGSGPFFEDLAVGTKIRGKFGRTVTDADNIWFTLLAMDRNPIHFDKEYTNKHYSREPFNGRLVFNGIATLAIVNGLVNEYTSAGGIVISIDGVRFLKPVFAGDTLYAEVEVVESRPSKSRPGFGIVKTLTKGFNQKGEQVIEFYKTFMIRQKKS